MNIECLKFKLVVSGALQGFADLWIPKMGIEIFGCGLYLKDGGRWISLPSREFKDDLGETKWIPQMRFRDKEHMKAFSKLAVTAIMRWCAENQEQPVQESAPNDEESLPF